ncbi:serine hydrolase domain-containing protein [Sphingomonas azotifigens]|uniref:serine hydrolase domain-containing protein n=1 Tax=Sphingomonas azotifigens TaxID=330920 RepID=UPI000A06DBD1|nr:serine hydrolase domain-containing protein [Sphingomonas azotifigens]
MSVTKVFMTMGALLACGAMSAPAASQQTAAEKMNTYLDQANKVAMLNGNVMVVDHGKIVLRRTIGCADSSCKRPLTLKDRFVIGSIAKEFDSVGLLMLAEQGKLSLTDPVSKFIPDLPAWAGTVTLDHLLHYTSGLPDVDWDTVHSDADAFRNIRAIKQLDYPAGTHYAYNNNNTFLRRRVIEAVSGMSYADFLRKREFPKAGIRDAVIDPTDTTPRVAKGFDAQFKPDPLTVDMTGWPALTLDDFIRWSNCIKKFCLITPESTRQIITTGNPKWQTGLGHGTMDGQKLVYHRHDGNNHNFEALLLMDASKDRTLLFLTSRNHIDVYIPAEAIDAILDGKPYAPPGANQ